MRPIGGVYVCGFDISSQLYFSYSVLVQHKCVGSEFANIGGLLQVETGQSYKAQLYKSTNKTN